MFKTLKTFFVKMGKAYRNLAKSLLSPRYTCGSTALFISALRARQQHTGREAQKSGIVSLKRQTVEFTVPEKVTF